jgi:hypothetical protein
MAVRPIALTSAIAVTLTLSALIRTHAQTGPETFTATAAVKTAGAASATAPMTIVISRKMSQGEAEKLTAAFGSGGAPALRKALANVPETGSIQLGSGKPTPTRLTLERTTEKGRLLTIVADQPILFLGAGMAGAKPKDGYDFAILDIEVNASGTGSGMFAPAAKVTVKQGTFVVEDYAVEAVRLTDVKKVK